VHITAQGPPPVSEMTYTVSSGTLNATIPYHTIECHATGGGSELWVWVIRPPAPTLGIRNIRSRDYSFPRLFVPMMELSFSRPFIPGNECSRTAHFDIRSLDYSFHGTFVLKKESAVEHSFPGPFDTWKFLIFIP